MTENKDPSVDSAHTSSRSSHVEADGAKAERIHTTIRSSEVKAGEPKVQSGHRTESVVEDAQKKPNTPDAAAKDGLA